MADDGAPDDFFAPVYDGTGLADHLPDGGGGHGEVVARSGEPPGKRPVGIFQVRQVDVNFSFQGFQCFHPLVAAAVVDHRHRKLWFQGRENGGKVLGGGDQVDVLRPLGNQVLKNVPEPNAVRGRSHRGGADGGVLAEGAPQGAASEKDGPAAPGTCQDRLLPTVNHGLGNQRRPRAAAEPKRPPGPVHSAIPGAQHAMRNVHKSPSYPKIDWSIVAFFLKRRKYSLYPRGRIWYDKAKTILPRERIC